MEAKMKKNIYSSSISEDGEESISSIFFASAKVLAFDSKEILSMFMTSLEPTLSKIPDFEKCRAAGAAHPFASAAAAIPSPPPTPFPRHSRLRVSRRQTKYGARQDFSICYTYFSLVK